VLPELTSLVGVFEDVVASEIRQRIPVNGWVRQACTLSKALQTSCASCLQISLASNRSSRTRMLSIRFQEHCNVVIHQRRRSMDINE
jgi:hypothetical protein